MSKLEDKNYRKNDVKIMQGVSHRWIEGKVNIIPFANLVKPENN